MDFECIECSEGLLGSVHNEHIHWISQSMEYTVLWTACTLNYALDGAEWEMKYREALNAQF